MVISREKRKALIATVLSKQMTLMRYVLAATSCAFIILPILLNVFQGGKSKEISSFSKNIDISKSTIELAIEQPTYVAEVEPKNVVLSYSDYFTSTGETEELVEGQFSEWFLLNDSTDKISIWKRTVEEGILVQIRNEKEEVLATFLLDEDLQNNLTYNEWTECSAELNLSTSDLIDAAFVAYHEVGGSDALNVQAQIGVLMNRTNAKNHLGEDVRSVLTRPNQYTSCYLVMNRRLKSGSSVEEADLEKAFYQMMLFYADEKLPEIETMPENVVYAARNIQGSGLWMTINGTNYCYK